MLQYFIKERIESLYFAEKNCAPEFLILSALKLSSCELVVFVDMNTYILTEDRNFKTFLKANYATALDGCYIFTKKILKMEPSM